MRDCRFGVSALVRQGRVSTKGLWGTLVVELVRIRIPVMTVYLCGWLITTLGILAAADWVSSGDRPPARVWVGVVAGALWPVVILGLVQLAAIAVIARASRTAAVRPSGRASSIRLKEVIAASSY